MVLRLLLASCVPLSGSFVLIFEVEAGGYVLIVAKVDGCNGKDRGPVVRVTMERDTPQTVAFGDEQQNDGSRDEGEEQVVGECSSTTTSTTCSIAASSPGGGDCCDPDRHKQQQPQIETR